MPVPITALYAGILALILTALAINVTVHRWRVRVPIGQGKDPLMQRIVRVHGNATEYVPVALLLMLVYELNGGRGSWLHLAGIIFVAARLLHAWGLSYTAAPNLSRAVGQTLTWAVIIGLAVLNLLKAL